MKLISIENYEIKFNDELLLLRPFKRLYNQDRTVGKKAFSDFLMILYFVYDLRSDFQYIVDEKERLQEVCSANGMEPYKFSPMEKEAIELYKKMNQSTSALLLQSTRACVERLRKFLEEEADPGKLDDKGKPVYPINTIVSAVKQIPQLAKELKEAEIALNKEITESGQARGSQELSIMDDPDWGM